MKLLFDQNYEKYIVLICMFRIDWRDGVFAKADNTSVYLEQRQREANWQFFHWHEPGVWTGHIHNDVLDEQRTGSCSHQVLWRRTCLSSTWKWYRLGLPQVKVRLKTSVNVTLSQLVFLSQVCFPCVNFISIRVRDLKDNAL